MVASMYKAISLYTGVGGLDFGFEAAGFETAVAVEFDAIACKTIRENRPKWGLIEGDIHDVTSGEILSVADLEIGEADVLIGGPPCQPFSKSSYWVSGDSLRLDDPRSDTLSAYLRVLRDTRPKSFVLENVSGLAYKGKDEGLKHLLKGIARINEEIGTDYRVSWKLLNSAAFGVPQSRERVFLVGSRDGKEFSFPEPTHCPADKLGLLGDLQPYRTAWDAIGDLPESPNEASLEVGGRWGELLPSILEGQNYLWHTNRKGGLQLFGWRTRYWSFLLKLAKTQPSWTIQAQPGSAIGPFHWRNRKLSIREMSRIQTFPDDICFNCSRTDAQKMLGNAVPSLMGEVLGHSILKQLLEHDVDMTPLKLLPPVRRPVPSPEVVQSVAEKYLSLLDEHADHPGEGRFAREKRRKKKTSESEKTSLIDAAE